MTLKDIRENFGLKFQFKKDLKRKVVVTYMILKSASYVTFVSINGLDEGRIVLTSDSDFDFLNLEVIKKEIKIL